MDMSELKELIEVFEASSVTEMDYERGELKVRLKKGPEGIVMAMPETTVAGQRQFIPVPAQSPAPEPAAQEPAEVEDNLVTISAPMVGIFYVGPAPDADPFVTVGQTVEEGQTVGIISAMKVMNEIKSEVAGTIREALAENGQAIEFGQPLFLVEPAAEE